MTQTQDQARAVEAAREICEQQALREDALAGAYRQGRMAHGYGPEAKTQWARERGDEIERDAVARDLVANALRLLLTDHTTRGETIAKQAEEIGRLKAENAQVRADCEWADVNRADNLKWAQTISAKLVESEAREGALRGALEATKRELTVPAAEYVPAIPAAWEIIDTALDGRG